MGWKFLTRPESILAPSAYLGPTCNYLKARLETLDAEVSGSVELRDRVFVLLGDDGALDLEGWGQLA